MNYRMIAKKIDFNNIKVDDIERFFKYVEFDDCWNWLGGKVAGYGRFVYRNNNYGAHRFSYFLRHDIPQDPLKTIDHLCKNTSCVNPDHLAFVARGVNTLRSNSPSAFNKVKTACIRGHEFSAENTGRDTRGDRYCRACRREHTRKWRRENFDKYTECNRANNRRTRLKALGSL